MNSRPDFWTKLDEMVAGHELVVDRRRGSAHPRHGEWTYPLDYGYLAGTRSGDGEGIDVWVGSRPAAGVNGVVCTVDLAQGDTELKLLLGCTAAEMQAILAVHNQGNQAAILVARQADEGIGG
ncbi:MAG: inorganic pyrophosphatase [Anaerolineae bacterium]|jgi:inorganic pyrophosphatase